MSTKPIKLHGHAGGPNPWKVAIILEELGVPYETTYHQFPDLKKEPFESLNPNGRVPAIEDPNTNIVVWESGAIIDYILATYDKEGKLSHASSEQAKWDIKAWRDFQMSGQGPYTGQAVWFQLYHQEKHPDVIARYKNEVKRVISVIDRHLAKTKNEYLTGNTLTYADLMFVPWFFFIGFTAPEDLDTAKEFPAFHAWFDKLSARPTVKKIKETREQVMAAEKK